MLTSAPTLLWSRKANDRRGRCFKLLLQEHPEGPRPFAPRTLTIVCVSFVQYSTNLSPLCRDIWNNKVVLHWPKLTHTMPKLRRRVSPPLGPVRNLTDGPWNSHGNPIVPLMNSKDLTDIPLRCQRLLLRLMCFNLKAKHVPGRGMFVADARCGCPVSAGDSDSHEEVQVHVNEIASQWPVSDASLARIRIKHRQKQNFDRHSGVQLQLHPGDPAFLRLDGQTGWKQPVTVVRECGQHSHILWPDNGGEFQSNRPRHLRLRPPDISPTAVTTSSSTAAAHLPSRKLCNSTPPLPASVPDPGHRASPTHPTPQRVTTLAAAGRSFDQQNSRISCVKSNFRCLSILGTNEKGLS